MADILPIWRKTLSNRFWNNTLWSFERVTFWTKLRYFEIKVAVVFFPISNCTDDDMHDYVLCVTCGNHLCCFPDIVNSIQSFIQSIIHSKNHSSRPIILCLSGGRVFATWLCSGQCLARVVIWVFLEVTEQGFRVWHWFMHVYDRLFKCVHIVIFFYNFTRLCSPSSGFQFILKL